MVISEPVSMTASSDDHDVVRRESHRLARVFDRDQVLFEIHHQALPNERVDADEAVTADVGFA